MIRLAKRQRIESDSESSDYEDSETDTPNTQPVWEYKEINNIGEDEDGNTLVLATYKPTFHYPNQIPQGFEYTIGRNCECYEGCSKVKVIWKPYWQPLSDFPDDIRLEIEEMIRIADKTIKEKEEKYQRFLNVFRDQLYEKGRNEFTRNLYNLNWGYVNSVGRNIGKVTNCCFCNRRRICAHSIKFNKKPKLYYVGSDCLKKMMNLRERKPLLAEYKSILFSYKNLKTEKETLMFMKKINVIEEKILASQTEYGHILSDIARKYN